MKQRFTGSRLFIGQFPLCQYKGFTLIELVMTIVILGFLTMVLVPLVSSISHSPDPMIRQQAVALGQALLDEIISKKWDENTPSGGSPIITLESAVGNPRFTAPPAASASNIGTAGDPNDLPGDRTTWDDVDDYDGLLEVDNFTDQDNTPFTRKRFTRRVTVTYIPSNTDPIEANQPVGTTAMTQATDTKRIVVTVISPLQETFNLVTVACNY